MSPPSALCCLALAALSGAANVAWAGTTVYRSDVDSVEQSSPPGAVGGEQVLIIEKDEFGNQRTLRIGHPSGTVTRPKPCNLNDPGPGMDCTARDLRAAQWAHARLSGGRFDGADLRGVSLRGAELQNASFNEARLDQADLSDAELTNTDFNDARLTGARLVNARLINAVFMGADMTASDLSGASLINTEFMGAQLERATWVDGRSCAVDSLGECGR